MKDTENPDNEDPNSEIDGGELNSPAASKGGDAWWDDLVATPKAEEPPARSGLPFPMKRRGNVRKVKPDREGTVESDKLPPLKKRNPAAPATTAPEEKDENSSAPASPVKAEAPVIESIIEAKNPAPAAVPMQEEGSGPETPPAKEELEVEKPVSDPEPAQETKEEKEPIEEAPEETKPLTSAEPEPEKVEEKSEAAIEDEPEKKSADESKTGEAKPQDRAPINSSDPPVEKEAESTPSDSETPTEVDESGKKAASPESPEADFPESVKEADEEKDVVSGLSKPLVSNVLAARLQPSGSSSEKKSADLGPEPKPEDEEDNFFTQIEKNRSPGNVKKSETSLGAAPVVDKKEESPDDSSHESEADEEIGGEEDFVSIGAEEDPWFAGDKSSVEAVGNKLRAVKQKTGCWTIFATLFFFGTLFLVVAVVGAGVYAWSKKDSFVEDAQRDLMTALEGRGIFLSYGDWSYQFPRGLVFTEMTFFQTKAKEKPAFKISNVGVSTDLVTLAKTRGKEAFGVQLDLADSTASLYGADGTSATELSNLGGKVLVEESEIHLSPLSTMMGGLDVVLNGTIQLPSDQESSAPAPAPAPAADDVAADGVAADGVAADDVAETETESAGVAFDPVILETLQEWFALTASGEAPVLRANLNLDLNAPDQLAVAGTLTGGKFLWSGLEFDSASIPFDFQMGSEVLSLRGFFAAIGGGVIGGDVVIDGRSEQIQIAQLDSTANLHGILSQVDPELAGKLGTLAFLDNPRVILKGSIPLSQPADSSLEIDYSQWKGFEILVGEKKIPVSKISGVITLEERKLSTAEMSVSIFGGDCLIPGGSLVFEEDGFLLDGMFEVDRMPLAEVAKFYGIDDRLMRGDLSMNFRGSRGKDIASMKGNGKLRIENARLNGFPVIGPVQMFTGNIIPSFSRQSSSLLQGSFIIETGVLITSDINVRSPETMIVAGAQIDLADGSNGIQAEAYAAGELAERSGFVDKAITMRGVGSLSAPEMELKELPIELADEAVRTSLGMTPASLEIVSKFFGEAEKSEAAAEEEEAEPAADAPAEEAPEEASAPPAARSNLGAPVFSD